MEENGTVGAVKTLFSWLPGSGAHDDSDILEGRDGLDGSAAIVFVLRPITIGRRQRSEQLQAPSIKSLMIKSHGRGRRMRLRYAEDLQIVELGFHILNQKNTVVGWVQASVIIHILQFVWHDTPRIHGFCSPY